MKKFYLIMLSCIFFVAIQGVAGEKMHIVSTSPDNRFAVVVVKKWRPLDNSTAEQLEGSEVYLIDAYTKKTLKHLEDIGDDISASWNKQGDGVIVFSHSGKLFGGRALKLKQNKSGGELFFSEVVYPDLEKALPRDADSEGGTWDFSPVGWTPNGDLKVAAQIGDNAGLGHVDADAGGYELHLRLDKDYKTKVIKVIRIKPTRQ